MDSKIQRILRQLGTADLPRRLASLPPSDLHTLMLEVFRIESEGVSMASLMRAQADNRFVAPAAADPVRYHRLEADLLAFARAVGIEPIMLSPLAPIGSCSAFGAVHQHKVLSAARGLEALADPSNALALLLAHKRKGQAEPAPLHLCATARVARAQAFKGKQNFAHFGLFTIVSGGRDSGDHACEAALLSAQLQYYARMAAALLGRPLQLVISGRGGYPEGFLARMLALCAQALPGAYISVQEPQNDNAYYRGLNFKLLVPHQGDAIELGDGGFVDWTARLCNNRKERCLISGLGIDRLLMLIESAES